METDAPRTPPPFGIDPDASRRIFLALLAVLAGGVLASALLRPDPGPPPEAIADDPVLVRGRQVYLARCASCHGDEGRGDGPIAEGLGGPPPRDLRDDEWKYGEEPETVLAVVTRGLPDSGMPGYRGILSDEDIRAVTAFVYYLGDRPVPDTLRAEVE